MITSTIVPTTTAENINMTYYVENNLTSSLSNNFGAAATINLQDYYVCTERWEIVIQDGAGTQLMKATNCDDSQMNCNQILVPNFTPTTTPPTITGPTASPTAGPTSPPVVRTRAFFVDTENYLGTMSSDYKFYSSTNRYEHNIEFEKYERLNTQDALYNNGRNGDVGDNGGTAVFYWDDPFTSISQIAYNPVIKLGYAVPGVYYDRGNWRNDPSAPQVTGGAGTVNFSVKVYLEVGIYTNYLVSTTWHSPSDLNANAIMFHTINLIDAPGRIYEEDNVTPASGRIRLELETNLGKDTIYVPWYNHPQMLGCLGNGSSSNCDYTRYN